MSQYPERFFHWGRIELMGDKLDYIVAIPRKVFPLRKCFINYPVNTGTRCRNTPKGFSIEEVNQIFRCEVTIPVAIPRKVFPLRKWFRQALSDPTSNVAIPRKVFPLRKRITTRGDVSGDYVAIPRKVFPLRKFYITRLDQSCRQSQYPERFFHWGRNIHKIPETQEISRNTPKGFSIEEGTSCSTSTKYATVAIPRKVFPLRKCQKSVPVKKYQVVAIPRKVFPLRKTISL